jgi:hypothetical protein
MTRRWHEPESHLYDDTEVALTEYAIDGRSEGVLEGLPRRIISAVFAGQSAHAGPQKLAVREDNLHSAAICEVVAVWGISFLVSSFIFYKRREDLPDAAINRISQNTAPTQVRSIDPERQTTFVNYLAPSSSPHSYQSSESPHTA